jgi:enterochelin esterase-like enzyme
MRSLCRFCVVLLATSMTWGADTPGAVARRAPNQPVRSPEIQEDGRVTFRLRAPKASEVLVAGQWTNGRVALSKGEDGVWTGTAGPVAPGVYEYSMVVDDVRMIDPGNPAIKPMREPRTSILHVPGQPPALADWRDVPHGTVAYHGYHSAALGRVRDLVVYTPPGYEGSVERRYPVLVLQHGMGDNHATWTVHGKAHWILDNLIAEGRAEPMVVVMLDGHAVAPGSGAGALGSNTDAFERDLLEQALPFVEARYRVVREPARRGIVGLSMGGGQSLTIGLRHADRFGWVGGFSSAPPSKEAVGEALAAAERTNERLRLLWIACGRDDFLLERNRQFVGLLEEQKVRHEWHLTDGDHSWPVWRVYLGEFLPRLFR